MLPVGPLMVEHRLIERMIGLMSSQLERIKKENQADPDLLAGAIDFLRTYADKCHHGKEEDILFKALGKKDISDEHEAVMNKLLEEHVTSRKTVSALSEARGRYINGDKSALSDISGCIEALVGLYTRHIENEDKHFFLPVMKYFKKREQDNMIEDFREFDRDFIHEAYKKKVEKWEEVGICPE